MFSAVFGAANRPERLTFLHEVKAAFPEDVEFIVFNTSLVVEADFPVVNAARGLNPGAQNPLEWLEALLEEQCPDDVTLLLDHARGELGFRFKVFERNIQKHVRMIHAFCKALDEYEPDYVYLWNQFNALHRTFEAILKRRGIGMGFFHDGVMPGSISLDVDSEMGESWIARQSERFMSIPVTDQQMDNAHRFLTSLKGVENNRHPQDEHISVVEALKLAKLADRPSLFFAGQNDWHAGIKPKGPSRPFHSPLFAGSMEALETLDRIAGELGLAVVFKPHPLSRDKFAFLRAEEFPNTVILQHTSMNVCFDVCDVTSTIASQASYVALQEGLPVMMLGRNQVSGKGLTYDVDSIDAIKSSFETALVDPLSETRVEDFARHVAQLERAYLFDYGIQDTGGFYSRGIPQAARLMSLATRLPVDEMIDGIVAGEI